MLRLLEKEEPIEVQWISELDFSSDWRAKPHSHQEHEELLVVTQGDIEIRAGAFTWQANEGSVVLYPRSMEHAESPLQRKRVRLLCLSWKSRFPYERQMRLRRDSQGRIQMAVRWILEWKNRALPESPSAISCLMANILLELGNPEIVSRNEFVERAKTYMLCHLGEPLNLGILSKIAGLSQSHFSAEFSRLNGRSPMDYLRRLRVQTSEHLILTTSEPLRTVAGLVGLHDEFHFSRVFRRIRGFPPSALRKNCVVGKGRRCQALHG